MQNFVYSIPTQVFFGAGQIQKLGCLAASCGSRALLVYGGGSIKKNGIYQQATQSLNRAGIFYTDLAGVEPNPKIDTVRTGVARCKKENLDLVIAIGGGSSIDCAKGVAAGAMSGEDPWFLLTHTNRIQKVLPVLAVPTMSSTGSEMDLYTVLSNPETQDKISFDHPLLFPKYAILDPTFTETVPPRQTAAGTADILSHIFEVYFQDFGDTFIQDRLMEGLMKTVLNCGPKVMENPLDYDARANLMWAASWAINGFIACGKSGPCVCHPIEHQLSARYGITHGEGLAIIIPHWMRQILSPRTMPLFKRYGVGAWGIDPAMEPKRAAARAIDLTAAFFRKLGLPETLRQAGIPDKTLFPAMAEKAAVTLGRASIPLTTQDVLAILNASF